MEETVLEEEAFDIYWQINNCCNKKVMKNGKIKESFGGYRWRRSEINFKLA